MLHVFFGVSDRAVRLWRIKGAPLKDPEALVYWLRNRPRSKLSVAMRLREAGVEARLGRIIEGDKSEVENANREKLELLREAQAVERLKAEARLLEAQEQESLKRERDSLTEEREALSARFWRDFEMDRGELVPKAEVERRLRGVKAESLFLVDCWIRQIESATAWVGRQPVEKSRVELERILSRIREDLAKLTTGSSALHRTQRDRSKPRKT